MKTKESQTIQFTKDEMETLHRDGRLKKDGHTYEYGADLDEAKERDYKAEYKKYGSSTKAKKYRAELNAYNRKKGTYGNGDGKDASHKGGKIVGFEKESVNRGRAEKSRLKKEEKLTEVDFDKIKLPSQVNRFLDKFVQSMKGANLNRMKRASILYKVIDAAGMTPQQLMADIQKIKTAKKEDTTITVHDLKLLVKEELMNTSEGKLDELGGFSISGGQSLTSDDYTAPKRDTTGGMKSFLQKFSSKEAKSIVDGQLVLMAKELRKVQGKVIKAWMDGAKSGQIDFFDIIRGLKTGDAKRAYPYETEFLVKVLTKDKIVDRFRSYFGGKKGKKRG